MAGGKHKSNIVNAEALERIRVAPDTTVRLKNHDTGWTIRAELTHPSEETVKEQAKDLLQKNLDELARAQELLYASDTHALNGVTGTSMSRPTRRRSARPAQGGRHGTWFRPITNGPRECSWRK